MGCCTSSLATQNLIIAGRGPRQDIRDHYKIGQLLGSGAFGQVRECQRRETGEPFAVKIMERRSREVGHWSNENMFRREVNLMVVLKNKHIVRHIDFYEDRHFLYAVMERCDGGELFEQITKLKRFSEEDASLLCRQMLLALAYIHSIGVVHRDIKAENFLFAGKSMDSDLKLIDFGMSAVLRDKTSKLTEVCGSPHYLSPELVKRNYNTKADMWALGVLIYLMLYGRYPFDGPNTETITQHVLEKPIDYTPNSVRPSDDASHFMQCLLERDAEKRYSAAEALQHAWIRDAGRRQEEKDRMKETNLIECVRSAHRKLTLNRKSQVSRKEEARRNQVLQQLEREWACGKTECVRLSPLNQPPNLRPEYARHDKRMRTTPGRYQGGSLADLQALRRAIMEAGIVMDDATAAVFAALGSDRRGSRGALACDVPSGWVAAVQDLDGEAQTDRLEENEEGDLLWRYRERSEQECYCPHPPVPPLAVASAVGKGGAQQCLPLTHRDDATDGISPAGSSSFHSRTADEAAVTIANSNGSTIDSVPARNANADDSGQSTGVGSPDADSSAMLRALAAANVMNQMMSRKTLHDSQGNFDWEAAEETIKAERKGSTESMCGQGGFIRNERRAYTVSVNQKSAAGLTPLEAAMLASNNAHSRHEQ